MPVNVRIIVPLFSTEDKEKIEKCVENLLGQQVNLVEKEKDGIKILMAEYVPMHTLSNFFQHIREAAISDSVRKCAYIDYTENRVIFYFHKQALYIGKLAVITQDTSSPLGNLELQLEYFEPEEILDWIAPQTTDGKEIRKRYFNEINNF